MKTKPLLEEQRRAEEVEQEAEEQTEIKAFRVFLKSGAHFDVAADSWDVIDEVLQDEDREVEDFPRPPIRCLAVSFYKETDFVTPECFIPFDQVAAIISDSNAAMRNRLYTES